MDSEAALWLSMSHKCGHRFAEALEPTSSRPVWERSLNRLAGEESRPGKVPVGIPKNAIPPPQSSGPSEAYPVAVSVAVGGGIAWSCRAFLLDLGRTAPAWSSYTHRCYNQDK